MKNKKKSKLNKKKFNKIIKTHKCSGVCGLCLLVHENLLHNDEHKDVEIKK